MKQMMTRLAAVAAALAVVLSAASVGAGQAAKTDVTGKWLFAVTTGAGSGEPTMTFKQDGEKLTGHYTGQFGEADLTGTVKGADIAFAFSVDVGGQKLDATYTGKVEAKDSIKGTVSYAGVGDGTFTAKKQ